MWQFRKHVFGKTDQNNEWQTTNYINTCFLWIPCIMYIYTYVYIVYVCTRGHVFTYHNTNFSKMYLWLLGMSFMANYMIFYMCMFFARDGAQGLMHAKQAFYHWATFPVLHDQFLWKFCEAQTTFSSLISVTKSDPMGCEWKRHIQPPGCALKKQNLLSLTLHAS